MNYIEQYKAVRDYDESILITINNMLQDPLQSNEMLALLHKKKTQVTAVLAKSTAQYEVVYNLFRMPAELKKIIGAFSNEVVNQKKLLKIEFYNSWFEMHKWRITSLMKSWTKKDLAFVLDKIKPSYDASYHDAFEQKTTRYKTNVMMLSKIECIINNKGKRSDHDMFSLLLAISTYDAKIRALTKSG
jgi:hypothetical protein